MPRGAPEFWRCRRGPGELTISPRPISLGLAAFVIGVMACVVGVLWVFRSQLPMLVVLLGSVIGAGILALIFGHRLAEQRKGDVLRWDARRVTLELPREGLTLNRAQVVQIEVIGGWWTDDGRRLEEDAAEIYVVVRGEDAVRAVPAMAACGVHGLDEVARGLAASMRVPLVLVHQRQDFWHRRTADEVERVVAE